MIRDFVYLSPSCLKEALSFLSEYKEKYKIISGGQSLLILMRQGLVSPEYLIDIKHLKELNYIDFDSKEGLKIGATTTHRAIEKSSLVKEHFPVLAKMEQNLASIQTRNWGTIGGNLAHADPSGDPGPVLIALKATLKIANRDRERTLPLEEFFVDYFETALEEGEVLLEIHVPVTPPRTAIVYEKFNIIRNEQATVSVAASITLDNKGLKCTAARIVLGASAPIPKRAKEAEQMLVGKRCNNGLLDQVAKKASEEAEPVADIHATEEYKRYLVQVLTKKMVDSAWKQANLTA